MIKNDYRNVLLPKQYYSLIIKYDQVKTTTL